MGEDAIVVNVEHGKARALSTAIMRPRLTLALRSSPSGAAQLDAAGRGRMAAGRDAGAMTSETWFALSDYPSSVSLSTA